MKNLMRGILIALLLKLLPSCGPSASEVTKPTPRDEGEPQSRYKIVHIQTENAITRDIMIDSVTGETWGLNFEKDTVVHPGIGFDPPHLLWRKIERYDKTEFRQMLEMHLEIEKHKKGLDVEKWEKRIEEKEAARPGDSSPPAPKKTMH